MRSCWSSMRPSEMVPGTSSGQSIRFVLSPNALRLALCVKPLDSPGNLSAVSDGSYFRCADLLYLRGRVRRPHLPPRVAHDRRRRGLHLGLQRRFPQPPPWKMLDQQPVKAEVVWHPCSSPLCRLRHAHMHTYTLHAAHMHAALLCATLCETYAHIHALQSNDAVRHLKTTYTATSQRTTGLAQG